MSDNDSYPEYEVFRGLQRPLEFLGFRGRYIWWAAATAGSCILGFIVLYILFGFLYGAIFTVLSLAVGAGFIFVKQHRGLHSKNEDKGIFIFYRWRQRY